MHEDSRWRRQPGKNIRNSVTNYRFLGFFGGLTASNPVPLDFFENRPLFAEVLNVKLEEWAKFLQNYRSPKILRSGRLVSSRGLLDL